MGLHDMLREGIVAGTETRNGKTVVMLDINGWGGDSGAGVFDGSGYVVGTITYRFGAGGFVLMGMVPMHFTDKQLAAIR